MQSADSFAFAKKSVSALSYALQVKLDSINADCETAAIAKTDALLQDAKPDAARFRWPSLEAAHEIWLNSIKQKERLYTDEISRALKMQGVIFAPQDKRYLTTLVGDAFSPTLYASRTHRFVESVDRTAQSYGAIFDDRVYGVSVRAGAFDAAIHNLLAGSRDGILAEVELLAQAATPSDVLSFKHRWNYFKNHPGQWVWVVMVPFLVWMAAKLDYQAILIRIRNWLA
jgi:hypothetical protein